MDIRTVSPTPLVDSQTPTSMSSSQLNPVAPVTSNTVDVQSQLVTVEEIPSAEESRSHQSSQSSRASLRYDPVANSNYYRSRFFQVWGRLVTIVWKFASLALGIWLDKKRGCTQKNEQKRAIQFRIVLTQLGPAFIKVGQALSTRPDLVSPIFLEELTKLQDQLPPFSNEVAYRFIEEELGGKPQEIYAELSADPLAAASLGQVYKGKLKTGETVAVKVQRPGLSESIALDIHLLRTLAIWAKNNIKRIRSDLVAIMDEFGYRIFEEMDYTHEGRNAERFQELYGHLPDIYVPKIYWEYTGRRVLTMEWVNGTKLTQLDKIKAQGIDARYLIEVGVQCSLRQLLEHGFFHADPHPGNLLASPDGKLIYLDFGMMSEVKPYQRYGLLEAVVHLVNRDFEGLAKDYVKLEFLTPDTNLEPISAALASVFNDALGASVAELNFKSITDQLSALMYEYPFRVPAYYALIIRSLVTLEGIAINVDPNFKVLSKAYPYVAKRLLTDPSPQLRASLKDLLFKEGSLRWNRMENLLKNARNSDDYDINKVLDQTLDFLFSERGAFIRERLANEIVNNIDLASRNALSQMQATVAEWMGVKPSTSNGKKPVTTPSQNQNQAQSNLEHIQRIAAILQETQGFDPMILVQRVPDLLAKPEVRQMGQQVAGQLAQRTAARLIRELLISEENPESPKNGQYHPSEQQVKSLPPVSLPKSSR